MDVTFREDANHTAEKVAAYNLNIIKKMALNTLKLVDVGIKGLSLRKKRYVLCADFGKWFEALVNL